MVSNTLIITGVSAEQLNDDAFIARLHNVLVSALAQTESVQFIVLKSFKRILLIFQSRESSSLLIDKLKELGRAEGFACGYALNDFSNNLGNNYLELPSDSRMFLISPPASPPVDFNYDATEEEPNKLQIYTHEDIQELFLKNNEELRKVLEQEHDSTKYVSSAVDDSKGKLIDQLRREIVLNDSPGGPKIVLEAINVEDDHLIGKAIQSFRTSLPPRSIFDDLDDD
ncbi:RCN1 [Cyberlindnera jadinii]|uniref:RCN1 protein n=1 Tax=Cyberlindnera jadinii (strain ATCC 18201 / CBS 1600 / BCRC 20928 / JCM 3617 / NBRC 0987 / NRRL Y-1542) TaxID=983966 RepID=A0A0H5BYG5_CYBJN|nr:hypothetical protein CYBJADRAFT_165228 [Cyberlindnera jadinii NRRL Y-1542]ODV75832.1 hypothetical protein CYBJADRAFT_165228 [Cyberlindnera jadinii NRRL Y-1542]CEP20538.1 RCN1 [Cyberlindnera jadinii]